MSLGGSRLVASYARVHDLTKVPLSRSLFLFFAGVRRHAAVTWQDWVAFQPEVTSFHSFGEERRPDFHCMLRRDGGSARW